MADTLQLVVWSLEQDCRLRGPNFLGGDGYGSDAFAKAQAYSDSVQGKRDGCTVYGDICVSSSRFVQPPSGAKVWAHRHYPTNGFSISETFREFGGPEGLFNLCGNCPANTLQQELAGCHGSLYRQPDSPDTDTLLRGIVARLGLQRQLDAAFPKTTLIWRGLWTVSPIPHQSLGLLRLLISELLAEGRRGMEVVGKVDDNELRDLAQFIRATELAEKHCHRLHASLLPPGHTELGYDLVFPHCPFCKAPAQPKGWWQNGPPVRQKCLVCGTGFSPAATSSSKRMKWEPGNELRDLLGEEPFVKFAREYLIALGESPEVADALISEMEDEHENLHREKELSALKHEFLQARIFVGLRTVPPPPSEIAGDDEGEGHPSEAVQWFDAENLAVAIHRAIDAGIAATSMSHRSASGEMDRVQWRGLKDPLALLAKWQKKVCVEKFSVSFRVPDLLVQDPSQISTP